MCFLVCFPFFMIQCKNVMLELLDATRFWFTTHPAWSTNGNATEFLPTWPAFFVKGWIARTRTYISTTNTTSEGITSKYYSQKRLPVGAKHCKTVSTWIRAGFCGISQASALFSRECGFESNWHLDWNWIYHLVDQGGNGKFHSFWRLLHIIAALA